MKLKRVAAAQEIKDKVREVKVRSSPHLKNVRAGEVRAELL